MTSKRVVICILLALALISMSFTVLDSSQESKRECKQNRLCVFSGDYLKYSGENTLDGNKVTVTETFEKLVSADKIRVKTIMDWSDGTHEEDNVILDLKTGLTDQLQPDNSCCMPFIHIVPVPIKYDKTEKGVSEKTQIFKGSQRTIIISATNDDTGSGEIRYDKQTGVLLYMYIVANLQGDESIGLESRTITIKTELIDTNIFQNLEQSKKTQSTDTKTSNCKGTALCITDKVTKIVDGDTIDIKNYRIRLSLTDAPEKYKKGFEEATAFTTKLCPVNSIITVDQDDKQPFDKNKRLLGKVTCSGKILNSELLYSGHAKISTKFCSKSEFSSEPWAIKFGCK